MKKNGFTLIELLIVITIIGILIAAAVFGSQNAFQSSRNTRRQSDIKQFQSALELFANRNNGLFPLRYDPVTSNTLCTDLGMTNCPTDPTGTLYEYCTDGVPASGANGSPNATQYAVFGPLEGLTDSFGSPYMFMVCSNGKVGQTTFNPNCGNPFSCSLP